MYKYIVIDSVASSKESKLESFTSFRPGWHFGQGNEFEADVIERAREVEKALYSSFFTKTDAFPGVDGEIMMTGYKGDFYVEITVEIDGTYSLLIEANRQEVLVETTLTLKSIKEKITEAWISSGSYQSNITTKPVKSSKAWLSGTPQRGAVAESRLLTSTVFKTTAAMCVNMLLLFTPLPESSSQPSSGDSVVRDLH